jgi:lysine 2,3-aminomutase
MNDLVLLTKHELIDELWKESPKINKILKDSENLPEAREKLFDHLNKLERHYFNIHSVRLLKDHHIIEKSNAKECIKVFKNIIRTENEELTGISSLKLLYEISMGIQDGPEISEGFLAEFIFLFRGIYAASGITDDELILPADSKRASAIRSYKLDEYSSNVNNFISKYKNGLDPELHNRSKWAKQSILKFFKGKESDWSDYKWHLKHIIKDLQTLESLVVLDKYEKEGLEFAEQNHIPFQITPYYLSLFNPEGKTRDDRAIRAQVLPSTFYCKKVIENRTAGTDMDFMGERSTSPVEGITRRYPQIVILKPVDVCPQICVYCQRNWEIKPIKESKSSRKTIVKAIDWIRNNENISEVLVTGGDPLILGDEYLDQILHDLSEINHIERIRIGTRVLVTLPMRITAALLGIFEKYHKPGTREICIVTHFEHSSEITPESVKAIGKIRKAGISIYNQQVFTYFNSARYESSALRKHLKLAGVDPYYTFNTKGKEETEDFRVPIARIEQERKEEARFLPGIIRTDEPVFNVPKLGKSHLRARQDHELIMISYNGQRVYRFYPWESKVTLVDTYIYKDVPIFDYLVKLKNDGEDLKDYKSIWYYF